MIELLKEDDILIDADYVEVRKLYKNNEGKNLLEIPEIKNLLKENDINISYIDENINVFLKDDFTYIYRYSGNIPEYPGVYIITFESGIIYIGSAINLYKRISQQLNIKKSHITIKGTIKNISIYVIDNKKVIYNGKINYAICEAKFLEDMLIRMLRPEINRSGKQRKISGKYIADPHSCAICNNRPIDFLVLDSFYGEEISNPEMHFRYKGFEMSKEEYLNKDLEERINIFGKCPKMSWKEKEAFSFNEEKCFNSDKDAAYWMFI